MTTISNEENKNIEVEENIDAPISIPEEEYTPTNPISQYNMFGFAEALYITNSKIRFNNRSFCNEVKLRNKPWEKINDRIANLMIGTMESFIRVSKDGAEEKDEPFNIPKGNFYKWCDALNEYVKEFIQDDNTLPEDYSPVQKLYSSVSGGYHDPFLHYLEELEWDGTKRLHTWLIEGVSCADTELNREASARTIIGAVARTYDPGCVHDWMPVLIGTGTANQGGGKSAAVKAILPELRYYRENVHLGADDKKLLENVGEGVIVEMSEMRRGNTTTTAFIKNNISRQWDIARKAYAHDAEEKKRNFIFIGTINRTSGGALPYDESGSRRYVAIQSPGDVTTVDKRRKYLETNRDQIWAEAVHIYKKNVGTDDEVRCHLIPPHLYDARDIVNKEVTDPENPMSEVILQLSNLIANPNPSGYNAIDLMVDCGLVDGRSTTKTTDAQRNGLQQFAQALQADGWESKRVYVNKNRERRWFPPQKQSPLVE